MGLTDGQQACVDTLDKPIAVSAGAGSGKTFTLTKRIVHALECGYLTDIDQVLAITFTNKAAGEIKSRVKSALRAAGMTTQALKVDNAWVSTIHGMCSRILRAHALELGIDPKFEVADEATTSALLEQAIEKVIGGRDDMISSAGTIDPDRLDALFSEFTARSFGGFGVSVESIVSDLVKVALDSPDGMNSVQLPPKAAGPEKLLQQLCDAAHDIYAKAEAEKEGAKRDAFLFATDEALRNATTALDSSSAPMTYEEAIILMNAFPAPTKGFGSAPYKEAVDEALPCYQAIVAEACLETVRPHFETLVEVAHLVFVEFSQLKRKAGVLDNSDLQTFTVQAFRDHPEIVACYADRFKLVMVDEFQDTNQLQVDIIKQLCGTSGERMCVVGDAEQSIYRFRGADVGVYRKHLQSVHKANPEGLIKLPDNFRSHADVLALCDRIFKDGEYADDYLQLRAGRDEARVKAPFAGPGSRVHIQVTSRPYRGVVADDAVRIQAARLAAQFAAFQKAGHKPGDMVVLLGGMTRAGVYANAMREVGLPCVVSGGSIFSKAPEVALMVRLAQALVNPKNSKALFEVASSEMFALSADDLLELSTGTDPNRNILRRQRFNDGFRHVERMVASGKEVSPALVNAAACMSRASEQLGRVPLSVIMQGIVVDSGWLARLEAQGAEGLARAANVYKVIRKAAKLEKSTGLGAAGVAAELAAEVEVAREAPGALSAGGGNSVRIMTVHASKGLEFPIVGVAEFGDDTSRASALLKCTIGGKTYASLDGGKTLTDLCEGSSSLIAKSKNYKPFADDEYRSAEDLARYVEGATSPSEFRAAISAYEAEGERAETRRKLYVALTRAKEALVISMCGTASKGNPTGLSKSVWGDVETALVGPDNYFEEGISSYDFGGTAPAKVSMLTLEADDVAAFDTQGLAAFSVCTQDNDLVLASDAGASASDAGASASDAGALVSGEAASADSAPATFDVPVVPPYRPARGKVYNPGREGVFSYSSISGEAGAAIDATRAFWSDEAVLDGSFDDTMGADNSLVCRYASDADSATTFGQAFHRSAQYAVRTWQPGQALCASKDRRCAIAAAVGLADESLGRLNAALDRWFASDLAARVAAAKCVRAEVPFMLDMGDGADQAFLEGEIDLLATSDAPGSVDAPAASALVVDYKTGGNANETAEHLHAKHLLQATCYAYAVLQQGYKQVECSFVRVEQQAGVPANSEATSLAASPAADSSASGQPQVVSYTFAAADMADIKRAILTARAVSFDENAASSATGVTEERS